MNPSIHFSGNIQHNNCPYCCQCSSCQIVIKNLKDDVWLNNGEPMRDLLMNSFLNESFDTSKITINFKDHGIGSKPKNVWWFSAGSWLFDPYCDGDHYDRNNPPNDYNENSEHTEHIEQINNIDQDKQKVFVVRNPKKTLYVHTLEDLQNFSKKYKVKNSNNCYLGNFIDWDKFKQDGWWGIAFTFRKVHHLGSSPMRDYDSDLYRWYCGWDVETMCVFDPRAVQDCTTIEEISI